MFHISASQGIERVAEIKLPQGGGTPHRVIIIGSDGKRAVYIMDDKKLYQADEGAGFSVIKSEELSEEMYPVAY